MPMMSKARYNIGFETLWLAAALSLHFKLRLPVLNLRVCIYLLETQKRSLASSTRSNLPTVVKQVLGLAVVQLVALWLDLLHVQ